MEMKKIKMDVKTEFDVIVNGEYQRRVTDGLLFEDAGGDFIAHMSGSKRLLFGALLSLTSFIREQGLEEESIEWIRNQMEALE